MFSSIGRVLFLGVIFVYVVQSKKSVSVHIEKIHLDSDKDFLNIMGKIRKADDGVNVVDVSIDLHRNVEAIVYIESEIFIKSDGVYTSFLKGTPVDICHFFANPGLNPLLAMVMKTMNEFGNKMTSCPINKMKYDIVGFRMDSSSVPEYIPAGDYRIEVKTSRQPKGSNDLKMLMVFDCDAIIKTM